MLPRKRALGAVVYGGYVLGIRIEKPLFIESLSMTDSTALLDRLADLVDRAKRAGADGADAIVAESRGLEVAFRMGARESLERAESLDLGLRVFVGDRMASVATADLSPRTLDRLAERAVAMAKVAPPDPLSRLARADELATSFRELDLVDPVEPGPDLLSDLAKAAEAAALDVAGVENSEGGSAGWGKTSIALATSNGFAGAYARTSVSMSATAIAKRDGAMERDYDWDSATHFSDLGDPKLVGTTAGERAVRRLGARRVKSQAVPVVFEQRLAGGLVRSLAGAINGAAIARGVSYLKDQLNQQVFRSDIQITDDPSLPRGMGSKPFDGEGLRAEPFSLIQDGVLTTWTMDLRSAAKLGLESNGRASRGIGSNPGPGITNLNMQPGTISPEALIGEIKSGLYITELIGHGGDMATGDYSRGASGYWIEDGELAYPVNELTIASNLKDMFLTVTPANDLIRRGSVNAPTLRINGMMIAGQ
ncbi:MAG: TldD/PmbA family protein [Alphaproteobacteria bacterium]